MADMKEIVERVIEQDRRRPLLVPIDFACNDPDNGAFIGRVSNMAIGGLLDLELRAGRFRRLGHCADGITFSRKRLPVVKLTEWYGNWCWNRYWMEIEPAIEFLVWLHSKREWSADGGDAEAFNAWDFSESWGSDSSWSDFVRGPRFRELVADVGRRLP